MNILTIAKRIADDRAKSLAAAQAGSRGDSAPPLSRLARTTGYQAQTQSWALTPRQRRRVAHKANLAAKRAALA